MCGLSNTVYYFINRFHMRYTWIIVFTPIPFLQFPINFWNKNVIWNEWHALNVSNEGQTLNDSNE